MPVSYKFKMNKTNEALTLFSNNHNCSQAIVCTYAEEYGMSTADAYRVAQGFGGGFGHLGYLCGALSGMGMVASLKTCTSRDLKHSNKQETYDILAKMVAEFEKRQGAINCKDILESDDGSKILGKKSCCVSCIVNCCDLIEEYLGE